MNLLEKARDILRREFIRNYCLLEMLELSKSYDIDILNDSVFIRLKDGDSFAMLSAPCRDDGEKLLLRNLNEKDKHFYTIDDWPMLTEGRKVSYHSECVQLYLPESVPIESDVSGVIALTPEMAPYIHERYDHNDVITVDYIRDRIVNGPAYGIVDHGVLAGWVMTHEEGTMGALTVLPEYRRMGYAQKLNAALVKSLRDLGKPAIVHIIKGNIPSITLSKKSGMVYSCDVHWILID